MTTPTTPRVLLALRLLGVAEAPVVAERAEVPVASIEAELDAARRAGWVRSHEGALRGWALTPAGRLRGEELLAAELDASGARARLEASYQRFERLNSEALAVCSAWQVRAIGGAEVVNDHSDRRHDRSVLARLGVVDRAAQAMVVEQAAALGRFAGYGPRLRHARSRVMAGDHEWFTRASIDSYHTVWFEWHEDLLATLGRRRNDEDSGRDDRPTSIRESA